MGLEGVVRTGEVGSKVVVGEGGSGGRGGGGWLGVLGGECKVIGCVSGRV